MKKNIQTPLRYPGGKTKLYESVKKIIEKNNLYDKTYVEPFAGGFGIGIKLMINQEIQKFILNDADYHIYALWKCIFSKRNKKLIKLLHTTKISINEWKRQKNIYKNYKNFDILNVAFATLFLNRTNFSGILTAGPIGGFSQKGKYKLNCRCNIKTISDTINELYKYRKNTAVYNMDAIYFLRKIRHKYTELFINFDPPYVVKGKELYHNSYEISDHVELFNFIDENIDSKWVMTYDNNELIKKLYSNYYISTFSIKYLINRKYTNTELFMSNFKI